MSHLFLGTLAENNLDMRRKGRDNTTFGGLWRGAQHGQARLTAAQVREIRAAVATGEAPYALSRRLGIGRTTIRHILAGDTWAHVL